MSGKIGITCALLNTSSTNKDLYFKSIEVLEENATSVKLKYDINVNLDKLLGIENKKKLLTTVNNNNTKSLDNLNYTSFGDFKVKTTNLSDCVYNSSTKELTIKNTCKEIEIANMDNVPVSSGSIVTEDNFEGKIILTGLNIKNTVKDYGLKINSYYCNASLHIKENTTNNICGNKYGIYINLKGNRESTGGSEDGEGLRFVISADNDTNAKLISNKENSNGIYCISSNMNYNLAINSGNLLIRNIYCSSNLEIHGGKNLFTCDNGLGKQSWDVKGKIKLYSGISVFSAYEPFGKTAEPRDYENIEICGNPVVAGSMDFYYACKNSNAGFSTLNTGLNLDLYSFDEDGNVIVDDEVEYKQPDGAGSGFIGNNMRIKYKNVKFSTGFVMTNNGTIDVESMDVISGMSGKLINNGTINNRGVISPIGSNGFELENNGIINNYNDATLIERASITGDGIIEDISEAPETTLHLSGQEGVDWVQETDRYIIKNTCKEITLSGSTNKIIETETYYDGKIILNGVNIRNGSRYSMKIYTIGASAQEQNNQVTLYIKENTVNEIDNIYVTGEPGIDDGTASFIIDADDNKTSMLRASIDTHNQNVQIDGGTISNGISVSDGSLIINNGYIDVASLAVTKDLFLNGGVCSIREEHISGEKNISDNSVVITESKVVYNELNELNKGLLIKAEQFKSIDDLKIFDINKKTGKITINNDLTIESDHMGASDLSCPNGQVVINEGTKLIANNLYLEDQQGNIKAPEAGSAGSKLINNGELTVLPGKTLYAKALYSSTHENNGTIYNFGEIIGKDSLTGTGKIIELDIQAEVNGELHSDITVDKINKTITINNLNPETDYTINLIGIFDTLISRSKVVKVRTAPSYLISGSKFNEIVKPLLYIDIAINNGLSDIIFDDSGLIPSDAKNIKDVSQNQDGTIMLYQINSSSKNNPKAVDVHDDIVITSKGKIKFNQDCSHMFEEMNANSIKFNNNVDTSNVTNMDSMFKDYKYFELDLFNLDTSNVENMNNMFNGATNIYGGITIMNPNVTYENIFTDCTIYDSDYQYYNFIVKYIDEKTKKVAENIISSKTESSDIYLDGTEPVMFVGGDTFLRQAYEIINSNNINEIKFVKGQPDINGIDLSERQNKKITGSIQDGCFVIACSNEILANKSCHNMFFVSGCESIIYANKVVFDNFNTCKTTNMSNMFGTEVDDSGDLPHVREIQGIENWDMSKVKDVSYMFGNCYGLLPGSITIMNPNINGYDTMFYKATTKSGKFIIKYIDTKTKEIAKQIVSTNNKYLELYQPTYKYGINLNTFEYTDDAVDIAPANSTSLGGWADKWPFNEIRCVGLKSGSVTKEIDLTTNKYTDGTTVPSDVDVMIEIPKVYWTIEKENYKPILRISNKKINSSYECYAHKYGDNTSGGENDYIYIGRYLGSVNNGKIRSTSKSTPRKQLKLSNARDFAKANGDGYKQLYYYLNKLIQVLYLMAYKNTNCQEALGTGGSQSTTGSTDSKGFIYGTQDWATPMCFLGIEDLYGNLSTYCDGIYVDGDDSELQIKVSHDNTIFSSTGSNYETIATIDISSEPMFGGYITGIFEDDGKNVFLPKYVDGMDNTAKYPDEGMLSYNAAVEVGGDSNYGDRAGIFCIDAFRDSVDQISYSAVGRLCYASDGR